MKKLLPILSLLIIISCSKEIQLDQLEESNELVSKTNSENQVNKTIKLDETTPEDLVEEFNFISLGCSLIKPQEYYPKETFIGIKIAQEISKISYIYFGGEYYRGPRKKSQWHKDISAIFDYEKIEFEQDIWNQRLMMDPEIWNWKFTINRESLRAKSKTQIPNGNTYEISWTCKLFENNLLNEYTENRILVESQEKEKHRKEKLLKEQEQLKKNKI